MHTPNRKACSFVKTPTFVRSGSTIFSSGLILPILIISFRKEDALGVLVLILLIGLMVSGKTTPSLVSLSTGTSTGSSAPETAFIVVSPVSMLTSVSFSVSAAFVISRLS